MPALQRIVLTALAALATPPALCADFVVTRLDDPSPDGCLPSDCSLREAVAAANGSAGADAIGLPAGTFTFTSGEIAVTDDVAITGAGVAATTLHNTLPTLLRVDGASLELVDSTIDGPPLAGSAFSEPARLASISGSLPIAIDGHDGAGVALRRARLPIAGGLVQLSGGTQNDLDVVDSEVDALSVSQGDGSARVSGSTISALNVQGDIDLDMRGTRVRGDTEPPFGGGLNLETSGEVRIADTEFDGAVGGIVVQATRPAVLDLQRIDLHGDSGPLYMLTNAVATITDSSFHDNTGIGGNPGAMHLSNGAQAAIRGSTFSNNRGSGDTGGAILIEFGAHALIVNSTFSANSFTVDAATAGARGAAIGLRGSDSHGPEVLLNQVTIVAPSFMPVGVQGSAIGIRGAPDDSIINVHNSILRGSCRFQNPLGGSFGLSVGNIESPGNSCGLDAARNLVDGDLALGTLGDHGGHTPTYLPAADSVAIGNAELSICLPDDQRGYLRPPADGCDVGAIEVDGIDRVFADGFDD